MEDQKQENSPVPNPGLGQLPPQRAPKQKTNTDTEKELPRLHTMKDDAARYLKDRNISFLDLVAKEHEYAQEHPEKFEYHERVMEQVWFRGVVGFVSVVLVAVLGYAAYVFLLTRNTLPDTESAPARSFIQVEEREIITVRDSDRAGLLSKLEAARRDRLPSRSIKHVVARVESFGGESRFASAADFFKILDFKPPSSITQNIHDKFDILIYYRSDGADVGFVFDAKDYERVLSGMLAWENTILLDFRNLYFDNAVTQPLHLFSDKITRNIDVRSIELAEGQTFSYGFFTQRFLVISTSENFMDVIIGRLLAAPPR